MYVDESIKIYCFIPFPLYLPQQSPVTISKRRKHKEGHKRQLLIQNDNLKSLTAPIRFSLVHAHVVNKIVNETTDAVTRKKQLSLSPCSEWF